MHKKNESGPCNFLEEILGLTPDPNCTEILSDHGMKGGAAIASNLSEYTISLTLLTPGVFSTSRQVNCSELQNKTSHQLETW